MALPLVQSCARTHVFCRVLEALLAYATAAVPTAGSMTVDGFTTHLGVAEELSADVARLVAAQTEVQQFLFPQYRAPAIADDVTLTPV